MKTWKKVISGILTTLMLLTTLIVPAAAAPSLLMRASAINDASSVLPIHFDVTNDGAGTGGTIDTLIIDVTDTDGLLTGVIGQTWSTTGFAVNVAIGQTTTYTLTEAIQSTIVAGTAYEVDVTVTASGSGLLGTYANTQTLTVIPTAANPAEVQDGLINDIDFDDNDYAPGDTVEVEIALEDANSDYNDITVEAWITNPSGDRVDEKKETTEFNMLANDDDETKIFVFDLPSDTDEGVYTLHVTVQADEGTIDLDSSQTFDVERADHSLYFESVDMSSTASAGETMDFAVELFNNGKEDETNVRTSVTISGVGVSQTSGYYTVEEDDDAVRYFTLQLPSTMTPGNYQVTFHTWNGNVDIIKTQDISVTSGVTTISTISGVTTSVDSTSKMVQTVTGGAYIVSVTNNQNRDVLYTLSVAGTDGWASSLINPSTVSLGPGTTGQVSVFVSPSESASGLHQFSVYVKEGTTIVDSLALTANVVGEPNASNPLDILNTSTSVLAIVLVILTVLWVWRREGMPRRAPARRKGGKKKEVYY